MKLHLDHTPKKPGYTLTHSDPVFLIGSCFSINIGDLLKDHRFEVLQNPSGIIFNPLSIANELRQIIQQKPTDESFLIERNGVYFSFEHHSSFHATNKTDLLAKIEQSRQQARSFLKDASCLIITFGTAFYYQHLRQNRVVANCHKQPAATFEKRLLRVEEITKTYESLCKQLNSMYPNLKLVFTVSPVKHLRDGVEENTLSKSTLIVAIHQLLQQINNAHYFPAFELVADDLRDYRFYNPDQAHPNDQAIAYVWEKFSQTFFSKETLTTNQLIEALNKAEAHQPLHVSSESQAHHNHLEQLRSKIVASLAAERSTR